MPGGGEPPVEIDQFLEDLSRWSAESSTSEAATARSRERWLRTRGEEEATLTGVLVDLCERRAPVVLHTSAGRSHAGRPLAVGDDFVVLGRERSTSATVVPLRSVSSARTLPGDQAPPPTGRREPPSGTSFAALVGAMAGDRRHVRIVLEGGEQIVGELRAAGADVLTLTTEGSPAATSYVQLGSVTEVSVFGSG